MSAALKLNLETQSLSEKPSLGKKVPQLRLVWENPKLSDEAQKGKPEVSRNTSYGRVHYNHHRYYDPTTGRYITSDPIGLASGLNTYGYAFQNPTKFIDRDGQFAFLAAVPAFFGGGSAAGSFASAAAFVGSAGLAGYYLNEIFGDDDLGDFGDDGETAHTDEEELLKANCDDASWAIPAIDAILKSRGKQHTDSGGHNPITNPDGKGHREDEKAGEKEKVVRGLP